MIGSAFRIAPQHPCMTILLPALLVLGCRSGGEGLATYMQPELLYLRHYPYPSLYVEIDAVAGVAVPQEWLDELGAILTRHCAKPGGITVVSDEPIPRSQIEGLSAGMVELMCTDGPAADGPDQPAYLHIFFHDTGEGLRAEVDHPYMSGHCPSTIFFNVDYLRQLPAYETMVLTHEAGHILGLCKNPSHGDGTHCRNARCLMSPGPDARTASMHRVIGARFRRHLCAACLQDLAAGTGKDSRPCSFAGPFLVRHEGQYAIASLPYYSVVVLAPQEVTFDWRKTLAQAKDQLRQTLAGTDSGAPGRPEDGTRAFSMVFSLLGPADMNVAAGGKDRAVGTLTQVANDPCPYIREFARQTLEKIKTGATEIHMETTGGDSTAR